MGLEQRRAGLLGLQPAVQGLIMEISQFNLGVLSLNALLSLKYTDAMFLKQAAALPET